MSLRTVRVDLYMIDSGTIATARLARERAAGVSS